MEYLKNSILVAVVLPFVPIVVGVILKLSLIDHVTLSPYEHFLENYLRGIWLELISISYIGVMAWAYGQSVNATERLSEKVVILVAVPAALFVLCLGAALGLPKFGIVSVLATVTVPAILGTTSLVFTSLAIRSFTK